MMIAWLSNFVVLTKLETIIMTREVLLQIYPAF